MTTGPFLTAPSRPPRRVPRALIVVLALVAVVAAFLGVVALIERGRVPVGTTVGGVDVGGMSESDARAAITRSTAERVRRPIRLLAPGGEARTNGIELGARPDIGRALAEALDAGVLDRLRRHVGLGEPSHITLTYRLGPVRAAEVADRIDASFGDEPRDGAVVVTSDVIEVVPAATGIAVDRGALRRALLTLPAEVGVPLVEAEPVVSTVEASQAAARVEKLIASLRKVRFRDAQATLYPARLRALVRTRRENAELAVTLEPKGLLASLRPRLRGYEQPPRPATFAVDGKRARVVPSRPGKSLDAERIAASLTKDLDSTVHLARFAIAEPDFTTEEARALGINELVSEFTTYYPCCPPRVANIQRGAQIMDGTIVLPGKRFSLNEVLGERTRERGFVEAPQIFNGRIENAVGGGVSQIATTTYNAAFFAGVQIITHQPHEFYISRYPMGREATVSWGGPELIWRNDWPAAILVKARADSGSITIQLYSSKLGRRVTTTTADPTSYTSPRTITVRNPSLPPGTTSVVQEAGPSGFLISYTRKVFRNGKLRRNEHYVWRYKPENAIVEIGPPAKPKAKREPKPPADAKPAPAEGKEGSAETASTPP